MRSFAVSAMSQTQQQSLRVSRQEHNPLQAVFTHEHTVQFYESEHYLSEVVARFLSNGFRNGNGLVVIATPEHHKIFAERLQAQRFEIRGAVKAGQLNQ